MDTCNNKCKQCFLGPIGDMTEEVALKYPEFFPYVKKGWRNDDNFDFGNAYTKGCQVQRCFGDVIGKHQNGIEGAVTNNTFSKLGRF